MPSDEMLTKTPLTLPNEIWIRVLENLNKERDLPDAWFCRHVSTAFKAAVESNFCDRHLSKTWIVFDLGIIYNDDDERVILDCAFDFDRLSEDKNLAIFKMETPMEQYHTVLRSRLRAALEDTPINKPVHTVQIRHSLNDTPIPVLSIDYEKWELSCDWRGIYTRFFGEEQLIHKYTRKWVKDKEEWTLDIQKQVARGDINMIAAFEKAIHAFANGSEESKKVARRARIRRQYRQQEGYEYEFEQDGDVDEEKAILEKLKEREHFLLFEEYSDDEYAREGSEDEGDRDHDESDEWEDEDEDDEEEIEDTDEADNAPA